MKLTFLELPTRERNLYTEQAATRLNISPVVLEKDFWVCWMLGILFQSEFAGSLVFKGGTSLSKVFGIIERFSEDIDLSLLPAFLKLPEAGKSRNQANKWMTRAEAACTDAVRNLIGPTMETAVASVLGNGTRPWLEFLTDAATNSPVLLFHYPSLQPKGFDYLKRSVKLEFGSLTDQQPIGKHPIRPWMADAIPEAFPDWRCEVIALELERTFWEKAHAGTGKSRQRRARSESASSPGTPGRDFNHGLLNLRRMKLSFTAPHRICRRTMTPLHHLLAKIRLLHVTRLARGNRCRKWMPDRSGLLWQKNTGKNASFL